MKIGRVFIYQLLALSLFSCGITSPARKGPGGTAHTPESDYPDSLLTLFYYTEGIKAYNIHGDKDSALALFGKAMKNDTAFAPAAYSTAEILLEEDPAAAVPYSKKAVLLDSANLSYGSLLGRAMVTSGQYEEARNIYSRLMKDDPHNPLNYRMLAALYEYEGQPYTAVSILDSAEYRLGRVEGLSTYKRQLLIGLRLYDKAIEETKALIIDYPYDDGHYLTIAELYRAKGEDSLALANYQEAINIDSTNVSTLLSLADFHMSKGRTGRYLGIVKRVFESDDISVGDKIEMFGEITSNTEFYRSNYFSINTLASTLLVNHPEEYSIMELYTTHLIRTGDIEQALKLYKSAVEGNHSGRIEPYYSILEIESYLERPDSVAKYSDMALRKFPKDVDLYLRRGYAMVNADRRDDAINDFRKAFRYAESDTVRSLVAGVTGDVYHQWGMRKKCYSYYDKALRINADNISVLNNYSYYLSEENRELEKALGMSSRANELEPGNSTFLDTQAWILYKLGRYDEAKKYMQQAISLDRTNSSVLLLHYGDILYELGDYFMAAVYWRRALDKGYDAAEIEKRINSAEKR